MAGISWPFGRNRAREVAQALLAQVSAAARQPGFYGAGRAADTLEGRLELLMLHGALALIRLGEGAPERAQAQAFADVFFRHIDAGLREEGVGDLSVPRRMRTIAGQFYGRLAAYRGALGDEARLAEALARNIGLGDAAFARQLAGYVRESAAFQAERPIGALAAADGWRPAPA